MRVEAVVAAAIAAVALVGCSGSGDDVPDGVTKPGSELKLGEMATVPFADDKPGSQGVTVLGVRKADKSDFQRLENPGKYAGKVAYYLTYRVTKTDDAAHDLDDSALALGADADSPLQGLNVLNVNPFRKTTFPCEEARTTKLKGKAKRRERRRLSDLPRGRRLRQTSPGDVAFVRFDVQEEAHHLAVAVHWAVRAAPWCLMPRSRR